MQRVGASLHEVRAKAVSTHILHLVLVGQRRDGALRVLFRELFPEEDEVCEAAADGELGFLEGLEVGLRGCLLDPEHVGIVELQQEAHLCSY